MPYRIAGMDVHKRMLVWVVSDVEIDDEYNFERRRVAGTAGPGSGHGVYRAVLETSLGSPGAVLAADGPRARRRSAPRREACIWRGRSRTARGGGGRMTSRMPNGG